MEPAQAVFRLDVRLPDEAATVRLAEDIAAILRLGDLVALSGGLGAGKTTFARGLLRSLAADPELEVPSPTFPLRIDHALARLPVVHADLYRLEHDDELMEIGLDEALTEAAVLVEWPERLAAGLAENRVDIRFEIEGSGRFAEISGSGTWPARLRRTLLIRDFLNRSGWPGAARVPLVGDASYRAYERILAPLSPPLRGRKPALGLDPRGEGGRTMPQPSSLPPPNPPPQGGRAARAILMNAPARAEGPAVKDGRSYDAIAHRALDIRPFVAIDLALDAAGVRVPAILSADISEGLLLTEDLGSETVLNRDGSPVVERYEAAIDLLAYMHGRTWPAEATLPDGDLYRLPPYDRDALLIEVSLFPDWFAGAGGEPAFPQANRADFLDSWSRLVERVEAGPKTWVMRDFHSPNILWQADAAGVRRVGVLDFQDALIGHPAYDVASLVQDARAPLTADAEQHLRARYVEARLKQDAAFDTLEFDAAYAILGAQRATKVLGIFTRLALAEGKTGYQRHRQRLKEIIRRNLRHPVLSDLRLWYEPFV